MPISKAEPTLLLCAAQLLRQHDPRFLAMPLTEIAAQLGVNRETGRRCLPTVRDAALAALASRRPGRPPKTTAPEAGNARALLIVNRMLLYVLHRLAGADWHRRLPEEMRVRLGSWIGQLRGQYGVTTVAIALWLNVHRKTIERWHSTASKERPPAQPAPIDPDEQQTWAAIRTWYIALRQLPPHVGLSQRAFVPLFNRVYADALAQLGIRQITREEASRIERNKPLGRKGRRQHPRGGYTYPTPMRQLVIDTTYLDIGEHRLYLIVLMDVGSRVVLFQEVFTADNTEAVLQVLAEVADRFGLGEFLVIDRGSPYLNDRVAEWLRARGTRRIVARKATPTDKACLERYNRTFKEWVLPHADDVGVALLDPSAVLTAMRLAARLAWQAYNTEPQRFIDGQSPLERLERHPLVEAARERVVLELRHAQSAPRQELIARAIQLLQLDITQPLLGDRLAGYGEAVIRKAIERCVHRQQSTTAEPLRDPLAYLLRVAEKLDAERRQELARIHARREEALRERARQEANKLRVAAERDLQERMPERALWNWIVRLLAAIGRGCRYGIRPSTEAVERLLESARAKLGPELFELELASLSDRIRETRRIRAAGQSILVPQQAKDEVVDLLLRSKELAPRGVSSVP